MTALPMTVLPMTSSSPVPRAGIDLSQARMGILGGSGLYGMDGL